MHVCDQVVDSVSLSSFLYIGGIPDDDKEANSFIQHNQLSQKIRPSQSSYILLLVITFTAGIDATRQERTHGPMNDFVVGEGGKQWRKPGPQFGETKKNLPSPNSEIWGDVPQIQKFWGRRETHYFLELNN